MHAALITGGDNAEREIALRSAETVREALNGQADVTVFDFPTEKDRFLETKDSIDVVVPVMHGKGGGEDGELQRWLEDLGIPYLFSGVSAHAIGMDKPRACQVVADVGLNVAASRVVRREDQVSYMHPVVVKPVDGGSSQGVTVVRSADELERALKQGFLYSERLMVEDYIEGREFTVGVMEEHGKPVALPVTEIVVEDGFFDYTKKYDPDQLATEICPANIGPELQASLQQAAVRAHKAIGARHLSRSDFMVSNDGTVYFLEINTIPGMTATSFLPEMIRVSGRELGDVLVEWMHECTV